MKKLIVTEKPSVAKSIAYAVASRPSSTKTHYITDDYLITWCYGHLMGLAEPEYYDQALITWSISTLPIVPNFKRVPLPQNKKHLDDIAELMNSSKVSSIICATDAGREGELIFRSVYYYSKSNKPVERLWLATMEPSEIKAALKEMKPMSAYDNLYKAARSRQEADWLVGINFTRLYSCRYGHVLHVGRVQSPTLAMIVKRFRDNKNFVPAPYYVIEAMVNGTKISSDNFSDKTDAEASLDRLTTLSCTEHKQEVKHTKPPKLFNLTAMQVEANRLFKYSAKQTLDILQTLYEKGYATYPRTDSRYITEAQKETVEDLIKDIKSDFSEKLEDYNLSRVDVSKTVNDKKVIEHHALLPTKKLTREVISALPTPDKNIALILISQLLEAVYSTADYECRNARFVSNDGVKYKASEKGLLSEGYLIVKAGLGLVKRKSEDKPQNMSFSESSSYNVDHKQILNRMTTAPALYTDADLLSAMTNISTKYELGTVATRHEITKLSTDCIQCPNMKELVIPDSVVSIQPDFVPYLSMMLKEHEVAIHASKTIMSKIYRAAAVKVDHNRKEPTTPVMKSVATNQNKSTLDFEPRKPLTKQQAEYIVKSLNSDVKSTIKSINTESNFSKWISIVSRFPQYSFNNQMLILHQRPDSTFFATVNAWNNEFGRRIVRGEHSVRLLAPKFTERISQDFDSDGSKAFDSDGKPVMRKFTTIDYTPLFLFDVSQTHGNEFVEDKTAYGRDLLLAATGVDFTKINNLQSAVESKISKYETLHNAKGKGELHFTKSEQLVISKIVLEHFSIDTDQLECGTVSTTPEEWGKISLEGIEKRLKDIQKAAVKIIDDVETAYEKIKGVDIDKLTERLKDRQIDLRASDEINLKRRIEVAKTISEQRNREVTEGSQIDNRRDFTVFGKGGKDNAFRR